jgi:hypothetical protein
MLRRTHIQTALPFGSQPSGGCCSFSVVLLPLMASSDGSPSAELHRECASLERVRPGERR